MREFFNGWRRKAGCIALLMACVLMVGWIRSRFVHDVLRFGAGERQQAIVSLNGELCWWGWNSHSVNWRLLPNERPFSDAVGHERHSRENMSVGDDRREWIIPYGYIALPLTLLSAYLILWKPRSNPKATPDA